MNTPFALRRAIRDTLTALLDEEVDAEQPFDLEAVVAVAVTRVGSAELVLGLDAACVQRFAVACFGRPAHDGERADVAVELATLVTGRLAALLEGEPVVGRPAYVAADVATWPRSSSLQRYRCGDARIVARWVEPDENKGAPPIRLVVASSDAALRHNLVAAARSRADLEVVGAARNLDQALDRVHDARPDVVLATEDLLPIGQVAPPLDGKARWVLVGPPDRKASRGGALSVVAGPLDTGIPEVRRWLGGWVEHQRQAGAPTPTRPEPVEAPPVRDARAPRTAEATTPLPVQLEPASPRWPPPERPGSARRAERHPPTAPEVVAVAASTGGPEALTAVLGALPADFPVPVLVVQHMSRAFIPSFVGQLGRRCAMPVREAFDGAVPVAGEIWIATGDRHLLVERGAHGLVVRTGDGPAEHGCRPAADPMFRALATVAPGRVVAAVLTGMGYDGGLGARALVDGGGWVIAQDEPSSVVYGMPRAVVEADAACEVLPLDKVAARLVQLARGRALAGV
jgi:two-component system chemotaxis response regulator CheB